ncbi:flagellar basal body-associated protein FliL [Lutispora sp.]|uniref:flagellar basal body-associated FliL family protein n=1 Tax=Lutispora sp. TaxID=2828727 RepID=UPI0035699CFA
MIKKNILLIIVIILIIVITFGLTVFFMQKNIGGEEESLKINKNIIMYSFDESFISNVKDSNRILKVTIKMELSNSKIQEIVKARNPEIRHEINLLLRGKTEEDLKGSEGQSNLQKEILNVTRKLLNTEKVLNVYFDEFIIQ